jgi:hypothetical protein
MHHDLYLHAGLPVRPENTLPIAEYKHSTWWVNSGETFEPEATVPVPAGGFVRRVAHTPHDDGVKKDGKEPAVIGIFGKAPIEFKLTDPSKPPVRAV